MRFIFIYIFCLFCSTAFSQSGQIVGHIINRDTLLAYNYWTIALKQGDSTIKETAANTSSDFKFKDIPPGVYSLCIQQIGQRDFNTDSLLISNDTTINLSLIYPPPCKFAYLTYVKNKKPMCPIGNHTNNIIPIVYGLPTSKTMAKAKKGLVHLGGCVLSNCDPHYYCIVHTKEL